MLINEIQELIFKELKLKTSVRKGTGSMKGYSTIRPMFQNGCYPTFPFDWVQGFKKRLSNIEPFPDFASVQEISIYKAEGVPIKYSKEKKPKNRENMAVKQWGSKNSQMRLDKRARSYAKKALRGDNIARFD